MIGHIARNEWRNLVAERAIAPLALLLTVLIAYGLYNGVEWNQFREATLAGTKAEQQKRLRKLERTLTEIEAGTRKPTGFQDPRSGGAIGGTTGVPYVTMPPGALAPLAVGQSDLYPYYFKISLRSKQTTLNNDEIENPVNLLAGRFDLAFVIVYLYPLLILALSYNILSGEKEQGTLALTLANPVSLTKLLAGKMLARAGLLLGLAVGITAVAVWVAGVDSGREGALARL
ncbi:MAG: ABC transporter permease, partial [Bryobacteraceae bacterium]|nr:ABC transporter permease [Bryobacteraceae bacterium]